MRYLTLTSRPAVARALLALALASAALPAAPLHAEAASAMMTIPDRYSEVDPGDRFYYELGVLYPENLGRRDLRVSYRIEEGNTTLVSGQYLKAVETQASFSDFIVIPTTAHTGLHTIQIEVSDGATEIATVSGSFQVTPAQDWLTIYFLILLAAIIGIGSFLAIEIALVRRR